MMEKNSIKEKIGDAISSRAKGVSVPIAAISAALLLMGIGAMSTSALADWYNPEESGHTWGSGGEYSWHTPGGIYGGEGWGPHWRHHEFGPFWRGGEGWEHGGGEWGHHPTVVLNEGESATSFTPTEDAPNFVCHHGFGGFGGSMTYKHVQC